MVITKVERQKKHPSRVSIHIDNEFAIGVHKEVLLQSGLRVGDQVTEKTSNDLKKQEEILKAREGAIRVLSHRARSEKELQDRLRKKGFALETVRKVIDSLARTGLIDDLEFARAFAHDKLLRKPMGKSMLKQHLRQKGISKGIIEQVLSEMYEKDSEDEYALKLARHRLDRFRSSFMKLELMKQKKRLADYLARRGFDWETVSKVVERTLGETA